MGYESSSLFTCLQLFELLLALASVPAIRLMITRLVFAPVQTKDGGEEELLQHIFYLAKRSVAVDNGASVSAIKLITYIYEVLTIARGVRFQAHLLFDTVVWIRDNQDVEKSTTGVPNIYSFTFVLFNVFQWFFFVHGNSKLSRYLVRWD